MFIRKFKKFNKELSSIKKIWRDKLFPHPAGQAQVPVPPWSPGNQSRNMRTRMTASSALLTALIPTPSPTRQRRLEQRGDSPERGSDSLRASPPASGGARFKLRAKHTFLLQLHHTAGPGGQLGEGEHRRRGGWPAAQEPGPQGRSLRGAQPLPGVPQP